MTLAINLKLMNIRNFVTHDLAVGKIMTITKKLDGENTLYSGYINTNEHNYNFTYFHMHESDDMYLINERNPNAPNDLFTLFSDNANNNFSSTTPGVRFNSRDEMSQLDRNLMHEVRSNVMSMYPEDFGIHLAGVQFVDVDLETI